MEGEFQHSDKIVEENNTFQREVRNQLPKKEVEVAEYRRKVKLY
jgi:hypothetical protein